MTERSGERLYLQFADILNRRDYDQLDQVMVQNFIDHHPGLVDVTSLADYRKNVAAVTEALDMTVTAEDVVAAQDKVFTRIKLSGRHVGNFPRPATRSSGTRTNCGAWTTECSSNAGPSTTW